MRVGNRRFSRLKIGLIADTHIGRNLPRVVGDLRRKAYRYAFTKAIDIFVKESVDYIIHAGDLFEKRSMIPSDSMFVKEEFQRLINSIKEKDGKDIRIMVVRGNHDGTSDNSVLEYIEHPLARYLKVIGDETLRGKTELYEDGGLSVVAVGYHPYIAQKFMEIKPVIEESLSKASGKRFLILHAFLRGYHDLPPGIPKHSTLTLHDLEDLDVETIVCGHHHNKKEVMKFHGKSFITPGATEAIDLADVGEHGVSIIEDNSYRFIPVEPLHDIRNSIVSSEDAVKPLEWFKSNAEAKMSSYRTELDASGKTGILRLVLKGKSEEDPFRLNVEWDSLIAKARESVPNLLHVQMENMVECVKQAFSKPFGGQDEFLTEALRPLGSLTEEAMSIAEEVEISLDEKASQRTGLLIKSDRQPFVERWMRILVKRARK